MAHEATSSAATTTAEMPSRRSQRFHREGEVELFIVKSDMVGGLVSGIHGPVNSDSEIPPIPIDRPISWEDWLKGRRARRELSERVAPCESRRAESSSDRRLRKEFKGERGLPFVATEKL